jgi:putative salt-induced outer membrane protein YdiY
VEYLPSLSDGQDYLINEETAVIANLVGNLALKVSFNVAYDNLPPPDFQKSDRIFKTALLYTF